MNQSPNKYKLFSEMIGKPNDSSVTVCEVETQGLIDSGSQVSTISEAFYRSALSTLPLQSMEDFGLSLYGPDGGEIPYIGYIWASVSAPFMKSKVIEVPALVVPETDYNFEVPVVIGTNVISRCQDQADNENVPQEWTNAFQVLQNGLVGYVKSTNERDIEVQPLQTATISGFMRKLKDTATAVTEPSDHASNRIGVCPRVVSVDASYSTQRVQVRIFNISAKVLNISPKSTLCELQEVKILRNVDMK